MISGNGTALYFVANGRLWRTDGTAAGTAVVPNSPGSIGNLTPCAGGVVFTAADAFVGTQLWVADGVSGAVRLTSMDPAVDTRFAAVTAADPSAGGRAYFVANDGTHGLELWVTDGTPAGTGMVQDLEPGAGDGLPPFDRLTMALCRGRVLLGARQSSVGDEIYTLDPGASVQRVGDGCGTGLRTPQFAATDPVLGLTMTLDGRAAPAPSVGVVLGGVPAPIPFGNGGETHPRADTWLDVNLRLSFGKHLEATFQNLTSDYGFEIATVGPLLDEGQGGYWKKTRCPSSYRSFCPVWRPAPSTRLSRSALPSSGKRHRR